MKWLKGKGRDDNGCCCLSVAIGELGLKRRMATECIRMHYPKRFHALKTVVYFNDHPDTTVQDVNFILRLVGSEELFDEDGPRVEHLP